ncbi:MAG: RHS repeat-associated core domain-containing protein [Acidobacteria bacterium]|nr:RHS repeat-associated core domain-containing protein [Acidobacteriota bacterium]
MNDRLLSIADERGQITTFTYDAGQRLATVTYDGRTTVSYAYDARNLLTRVSDSLSGAWLAFSFDADGRLTEIRRSNGVTTVYTYDAAGRVTRIQDGVLADQQYALNAEGEPTQARMNVPLGGGTTNYTYDEAGRLMGADYGGANRLAYSYDPAGNLVSRTGKTPLDPAPRTDTFTPNDASELANPGYASDARGRQTAAPGKTFAYDGATRLTQVTAGGSTATFSYNGLDDLRTRTVGGTTTTFYHNYAIGLAPIVVEYVDGAAGSEERRTGEQKSAIRNPQSAIPRRFYVYTPGGQLLYSIDAATNQVRFYHFDRLGSTLFLTNGAGGVSDAYAYDPYGRLLGQTGTSDQPFTFVGRYGVRWEPVGGLYDMRARTYDPATARFLTRDPVWPVLDAPEGLNPYQYALQKPLQYVDPGGTQIVFSSLTPQVMRQAVQKGVAKLLSGVRLLGGLLPGGGLGLAQAFGGLAGAARSNASSIPNIFAASTPEIGASVSAELARYGLAFSKAAAAFKKREAEFAANLAHGFATEADVRFKEREARVSAEFAQFGLAVSEADVRFKEREARVSAEFAQFGLAVSEATARFKEREARVSAKLAQYGLAFSEAAAFNEREAGRAASGRVGVNPF